MQKGVDWTLLGRYGLFVAFTVILPVPVVDRVLENAARRRLVRAVAARHGITLEAKDVAVLGNIPSGGCLGLLWGMLLWPVKKILRTFLLLIQAKAMADAGSEVVHRGLLLEEAFEQGWLPGDAARVRGAMDRALQKVDVRVVERQVLGRYLDERAELNRLVHETTRVARERLRSEDRPPDEALAPGGEQLSGALLASLRGVGLVPELVQWFRAEMGAPPRLEARMPGPLDAELLEGESLQEAPARLEGAVEDAVEVDEEER